MDRCRSCDKVYKGICYSLKNPFIEGDSSLPVRTFCSLRPLPLLFSKHFWILAVVVFVVIIGSAEYSLAVLLFSSWILYWRCVLMENKNRYR